MSGKTLKIVGIFLAGAMLVIGALALTVKFILTPERVKGLVIPLLEERLGAKVSLGKLKVSLFSGINIANFSITGATGSGSSPLFSAESLSLNYRLLPLIARKVVIEAVEISQPVINIEQKSSGRYNFTELGKPSPQGQAKPAPSPPRGRGSFVVSVNRLSLTNGKVHFQIYRGKGEKPARMDLDKVRINLTNISESGPVKIDGTVALAGKPDSRLKFKGEFNPTTGWSSLFLEGAGLPMEQFYSYLVADKSGQVQSGTLGMDIKVSGQEFFQNLSSQGTFRIAGLGLKAFPERLNLFLEYDATFKYRPGTAGADSAKGTQRAGSPFHGEAVIKNLVLEFPGPDNSGKLKPNIKTRLRFNPDRIEAKELSLRLGQSQLSGSALVKGYLRKDQELTFTLRSDLLDLEELISLLPKRKLAGQEQETEAARARAGLGTERKDKEGVTEGQAHKDLRLAGKLEAAKVKYKTFFLEELRANLDLRQSFLKEEMTSRLGGGTLASRGTISMNDRAWPYQGEVNIQGVKIAPLIQAAFPRYAYLKEGSLSAEMRLAGQGIGVNEIKNNLGAAVTLLVSEGKVDFADLLKGYQQYFKLDRLKAFGFRAFRSTMELQKGTLYFKETNLESPDLRFSGKGRIGLVVPEIDYNLEATVSSFFLREALAPLALVPLLRDEQSFITFPLQIRGTLSSPKVRLGLRPEDIIKRLQPRKKGSEEILDKLQRFFSR